MKVLLIRHAHGLHQQNHDYSIFDPELSKIGIEQCNTERDKWNEAELVISSNAVRTLQTASLIFPSKKVYGTDLLLEYNTGVYCNCRNSLAMQSVRFPRVDFDAYRVAPLDREITWEDGAKRAQRLMSLLKLFDYKVVAIVTHQNFAKNVLALLGEPQVALENCQVYTVEL